VGERFTTHRIFWGLDAADQPVWLIANFGPRS